MNAKRTPRPDKRQDTAEGNIAVTWIILSVPKNFNEIA
jgi:hypothetical protein